MTIDLSFLLGIEVLRMAAIKFFEVAICSFWRTNQLKTIRPKRYTTEKCPFLVFFLTG
jgi:hypothetical protein